jgi:hypothetical protein
MFALMLSMLVPPVASYMYYQPVIPTRALSHFGSFASPFDSMFDDLLRMSRTFAAPTLSFGPSLLDAPLHSQLSSLMHGFDSLDVPFACQPRWIETDDAVEMAFRVQPDAQLSVEVVEGSLQLKAVAGKEGAEQRSASYSISLPFELNDPRAVEALRDTDGARLTLRVPKRAAVKPPELERIQLEIKSTPALGAPTTTSQPEAEHGKNHAVAVDEKFAFAHKEDAQDGETSKHSTL